MQHALKSVYESEESAHNAQACDEWLPRARNAIYEVVASKEAN
jgi:hypothetical protein